MHDDHDVHGIELVRENPQAGWLGFAKPIGFHAKKGPVVKSSERFLDGPSFTYDGGGSYLAERSTCSAVVSWGNDHTELTCGGDDALELYLRVSGAELSERMTLADGRELAYGLAGDGETYIFALPGPTHLMGYVPRRVGSHGVAEFARRLGTETDSRGNLAVVPQDGVQFAVTRASHVVKLVPGLCIVSSARGVNEAPGQGRRVRGGWLYSAEANTPGFHFVLLSERHTTRVQPLPDVANLDDVYDIAADVVLL